MLDPIVDGFSINGQLRATLGSGRGSRLFEAKYDPNSDTTSGGGGGTPAQRFQAGIARRRAQRKAAREARKRAFDAAVFGASAAKSIAEQIRERREAREEAEIERRRRQREESERLTGFIEAFFKNFGTARQSGGRFVF
jgi:hypothetical protein